MGSADRAGGAARRRGRDDRPAAERRTRLLVRDRAAWRIREWPFAALIYEPLHACMETGLIRGLKQRVEQSVSLA